MTHDAGYYATAALMLLACLLKLPAVIRARGRDWLLNSICALLLVGAGDLAFVATTSIAAVNRATGVPNIAAPIVYILLTGFSGASLVLVLNWRGGTDAAQTRRQTRITIASYVTVCTLIALLFALGDASVEQRTRFDTYYASTAYLGEMIALYLSAHAVASLTVSRLCWRWSREVHGTLRIGLRVLAAGYLLHYANYDATRLVAVAARWAGHDWDVLLDVSIVTAQPSAVLIGIGFILPLVGLRSDDAIRYWQLAPLARTVRPVQGASSPAPPLLPWWSPSMRLRLTQRHTYISDRIMACRGHCDPRVWEAAHAAALAHRATEEQAAIIADAAMIAAAVEAHTAAVARPPEPAPVAPDHRALSTRDLARLSRALGSRVVKDIRHRATTESATA
ncbi:DUF6545 domain-containing protein [Streptomyces odontomachi]|uniref:DUF6545 domain-containing protein n=1 Tax=Streptomyces odontomachi TaxID=2944940 RepID=UPI00210E97CF|nr:DUF6545 domain-containing protein [Streptomyces sp. ODS25]